ncbi:hypothetical protein PZA11_002805 [Diplocarpon coronariae]|nr:hypothetical protein JHW43_002491 [Diplocarpon mali]
MASSAAAQNWLLAQQVESRLKTLMKSKDHPTYNDINHALSQLRGACEAVIFADFEYSTAVGVEKHLWDVHILINNRYRKLMEHYKKATKNHIERRATAKHYADFIKTSQYFYKSYIQRIASHFDGLELLYRIANRLSLSLLAADRRVKVSPEIQQLVEISCYTTLLHLGDLSRYRNGFRTKDRSWQPALGYYALANDFRPTDGAAHSQMSVIALADQHHLDAVFHLYRALTTACPYSLAKGNLETEFKKVISAWEKKAPQQSNDKLGMLCWWFVLLHAKFYQGQKFLSTQKELEKEILSRLSLLLKEQSFADILAKLVIINIAAQYFAQQRIQTEASHEAALCSYTFCLEFNIRFFTTLLQTFLPELEDQSAGEDITNVTNGSLPEPSHEKITVVARRVLPAIRQYSTWLVSNIKYILLLSSSEHSSTSTAVHIKEMWKIYAQVLTRLTQLFPEKQLASVGYLLEEDEATLGFEPLRDNALPKGCDLFKNIGGEPKPRLTVQGLDRHHPNVEMKSRIQDIFLVGLTFHLDPKVPINLDQSTGRNFFLMVEEVGSPLDLESSLFFTPTHTSKSTFSPRESDESYHEDSAKETVTTYEAHQSMETDMLRMVDDLVEPSTNCKHNSHDETSYGMHSRTANDIFAPVGSNGYGSQNRSTPKMLPSLPGFQNSAFAPQKSELKPTSPHRGQFSPIPLSTRKQQLDAAANLEKMTGYSRSGSSWGQQNSLVSSGSSYKSFAKQLQEGLDEPGSPMMNSTWGPQQSRPASGSLPRSVNQILQESLSQQYMPLSSCFSDSSSLYANTTPPPARYGVVGAKSSVFGTTNGNNSTTYVGASDFDRDTMLQSSLWNGSQHFGHNRTPPGGQGD